MLKIQIADRGVALTTNPHRATRLQKRSNCTPSSPSGSFGPFKGEFTIRGRVKCMHAPTAQVRLNGNVGCDVTHKPSRMASLEPYM